MQGKTGRWPSIVAKHNAAIPAGAPPFFDIAYQPNPVTHYKAKITIIVMGFLAIPRVNRMGYFEVIGQMTGKAAATSCKLTCLSGIITKMPKSLTIGRGR